MNVTKDGFKDRQLHIEDYLQMVSAEQKEDVGVSVYQRITENNNIKLENRRIPNGTYVRCGRSANQLMVSLLPDKNMMIELLFLE